MADDSTSLNHMDLLLARKVPGADQSALAPLEHQAFAREYAAENPISALGLVAGIPAYQAAKGIGLLGSRTGASQPGEQMAAGYKGLGQGWGMALRRFMDSVISPANAAGPSDLMHQGITPEVQANPARVEAVGASPADRRGVWFGVPRPAGTISGNDIVKSPYAPTPAPAPQTFESEYERELRVLRGGQNSIGGTTILNK